MNESVQNIIKLIRQFSIKSIFFKYLKQFTVILLLPFLILNLLVYFSYKNIMTDKTSNMLTQSTALAHSAVTQQLDNADSTYLTLLSDSHIADFLDFSKNNYSSQNILDGLTLHTQKNEYLESITLYSFSKPYIFSTDGGGSPDNFKESNWYKHYISTGLTNFVINSGDHSLTFCYGVYKNSNCNGLIVLNYNSRNIDNKLVTKSTSFFLVDSSDNVIYSTDKALLGKNLKEYISYSAPANSINGISPKHFGDTMTASCKFEIRPLSIVGATTQDTSYLYVFLILAILISLLLSVLLALYISISSYRTITEIIAGFSSLETAGNIEKHTNEIGFIMQNLMQALDKSKHIETELADKMALLKKTQLAAMQLQFNQHFLFNTLNLISMSARAEAGGKKNTTSSAISLLADLLRISLNTEQYIINVFAELMYAKKYVEIEQLKLKNMFDVVWDVDEELYECKVVKLIFQPLIENAFRHGLQPLPPESEKRLIIKGKLSGDNIEFHVIDNGVGIPAEKLKQINDNLSANIISEASHIGLSNVNTRLKLVFGDSYGLSVSSDNTGTDVKILIPNL